MATRKKATTKKAAAAVTTKALAPIAQALQGYADKTHNVLAPLTFVDRLPQMTRLSVRIVQVTDVSKGSPDCYHSSMFMAHNERAPSKLLLDKIAGAAGLSWEANLCRRMDDCKDPHLCIMQMGATLLDYDGVKRQVVRQKMIDFRDGSPQLKGFSERQIAQARARILELAESKASNRVVRAALSLKQKYTTEEIQRPFVIPRLVPDFDMGDPDVKRMMVEHRLGVEAQLYGPPPGAVVVDHAVQRETPGLGPATADDDPDVIDAEVEPDGPVFPGDDDPPDDGVDVRCGCNKCVDKETGEVCAADLTGLDTVIDFTTQHFGGPLCELCCPASKKYDREKHG